MYNKYMSIKNYLLGNKEHVITNSLSYKSVDVNQLSDADKKRYFIGSIKRSVQINGASNNIRRRYEHK